MLCFAIRFAIILFSLAIIQCNVGDRARAECRKYGESMIECQRILHGVKTRTPADLLDFPHMVLIGFIPEPFEILQWNCGGSLISPKWVLTAAHCLGDSRTGPARKLLVGSTSFEYEESEDLVQQRDVDLRVAHPDFKPPSKYHDIALVSPDRPFVVNRDVRIACLNTVHDMEYTKAIATGFGKTRFDIADGSANIMQVELDIVPTIICNETMKSMMRSGVIHGITESQICAGDLEKGGKDTCQGDSGGPLQVLPKNVDCKNTYPLHLILGVTSFGRFCGFKHSPGVYTRVSYYIEWIEQTVWPSGNISD